MTSIAYERHLDLNGQKIYARYLVMSNADELEIKLVVVTYW